MILDIRRANPVQRDLYVAACETLVPLRHAAGLLWLLAEQHRQVAEYCEGRAPEGMAEGFRRLAEVFEHRAAELQAAV